MVRRNENTKTCERESRVRGFEKDRLARALVCLLLILVLVTGGMLMPYKSELADEEGLSGMLIDSAVGFTAYAETVTTTQTVTETKTITDVAYYDIWKHINGTWQFGKKQGSSVSADFTIYIAGRLPDGAEVTAVSGSFDDSYSGAYSEWAVPSASISVDSFTNTNLTYTASTTLNGSPMDLRQDTQSEYTEGYRYYIPANFEVTYTIEKEVAEEVQPEEEEPSVSMAGEAILDLPFITYEGHSARAEDRSVFDVDGESYGAARMYDEGLASNSFKASGDGKVKRVDDTEADVTFNSLGEKSVTLTVKTDSGDTLTDKKYIEVLKTPAILETLGGTQKENRRQVLTILVAENPSYPLTELWVELEEKGGNSMVHLDHDVSIAGGAGSGSNVNSNNGLIKTRAISDFGSDSKFTRVQMEFLTKNDEKLEMTYRIYAKDTRGNIDLVEEDFTVMPDTAPDVSIFAENPQLRDERSNVAYVYAEDRTLYDGDNAERTWYVREEVASEEAGDAGASGSGDDGISGSAIETEWTDWMEASESDGLLMDASFGTWRGVAYKKTGVGKVEFRLDVTDVWVEETLEEYVNENDRLTGSGTKETMVDNIAPLVSLSAEKMKKGNLLMIAISDEEHDTLSEKNSAIEKSLLESGISTNVQAERMKSESEINTGSEPDAVAYLSRTYGYGVESTFVEKQWYMVDEDTLYTVDGTWTQNTKYTSIYYYDIGAPYTINAYDLSDAILSDSEVHLTEGADTKWQITITSDQIGGVGASSIKGMVQDDSDTYLYFIAGSKTLVYDKESGSLVAEIPMAFGDDNFVSDGRIFTLKSDGLYSVNMRTGVINNLYSGKIVMKSSYCDPAGSARRINNEIVFIAGSGTEIMRVSMDPETEEFRQTALRPSGAGLTSTYNIIGFAANGEVIIGRDSKSALHVFDRSGNEVFTKSGWSVAKEHDILPAYKSDGNFDYVAVLYNGYRRTGTSSSGYKYRYSITETVYDIRGVSEPLTYTYERVVGASGTTGCGTDAGKAMYAVQLGNCVIVDTGNWSTCISDGSALSSYYNTSFTQMIFDMEARTTKAYKGGTTLYAPLSVGGVICEYGKATDEYIVSAYSNVGARYTYGEGTNVQALRVARMPKTEDIEIAMGIDKYAPVKSISKLDSAAVIVSGYKEADTESENTDVREIGAYTTERVDFAENDIVSDISASDFSEEVYDDTILTISNALSESSGESGGIRVITKAGGDEESGNDSGSNENSVSTITKTYSLEPDKEYFYEMEYSGELKEPVKTIASFDRAAGEIDLTSDTTGEALDPQFSGNSYIVTHLESEDFSAFADVNAYFSGITSGRAADGVYYGAELHRAEDSGSNKARSDSSSLTFTVPDGEQAILEFEYKMSGEDGYVDETFINIDGVRWYRNSNFSDSTGVYTHPFLLEAGEHTLSFGAKGYGTRPIQTYMIIDNLKVMYVEEWTGTSGDIAGSEDVSYKDGLVNASVTEIALGGTAVKGSFRTPHEIVSYAGQDIRYINAKPDAGAIDIITRNDGTNTKSLVVNIPEDQKAVFTAITLASGPVEKRAVKWTFEGKSFSVKVETSNGNYPLSVAKSFRMTSDTSSGSFSAYTANLYKVSAGFNNAEMVLTNVLNSSIDGKKYFITPDSEELFFQDEVFNGNVELSISGTGEWTLKNFRLYYIEDGRKVYLEDGYMTAGEAAAFEVTGGEMTVESIGNIVPEEVTTPVYQKGETVKYDATYFDYENDPSKREYWRYTHVEANDGPHPDAGLVLDAPITEFFIDGKYTVEHWQEDSTGREDYDKLSNVVTLTFYIEGTATAPWIEVIKTEPAKPQDGDSVRLAISVNDFEKDPLNLLTEVYCGGILVYTHTADAITPLSNGRYPITCTDSFPVKEGRYNVVCTVKDELGVGFGTYDFDVEPGMKIDGSVGHFPAWEQKRLEYNTANPEHPRSKDTFWANEAFNLSAEVHGAAEKVTVTTCEYPQKTVTLTKSSASGANVATYTGSYFDSSIASELVKEGNCDLTFIFTATYAGGKTVTDEVTVIIDDTGGSGTQIHRVW